MEVVPAVPRMNDLYMYAHTHAHTLEKVRESGYTRYNGTFPLVSRGKLVGTVVGTFCSAAGSDSASDQG